MRHGKKDKHFSRPRAQRKALLKSLIRSVVISGRIKTTDAKAKELYGDYATLNFGPSTGIIRSS